MTIASPLTYSWILWNSSKYVSVGCATTGAAGLADDIRFSTFSCATMFAPRPTASTAAPKPAVRGKKPDVAIFSLPPM